MEQSRKKRLVDVGLDRRALLEGAVALGWVCVGGASASGCASIMGISETAKAPEGSFAERDGSIVLDISKIPSLKLDGGQVKLEVERPESSPLRVLVIRENQSSYRAYHDRCTHDGRTLAYQPARSRLECESFYRSQFDLEGAVVKGPAGVPLRVYEVRQRGEELEIALAPD